ncbi:MAG TPA: ribonuclease T2 [Bauldia sp.]|nr:ribonuclease T2 [Bauldia sp.]
MAPAGGEPGDFDFYVLTLSWSPSYCETAERPDPAQCDVRGKGFVVHGLWPQYERGYPEYCAETPRLSRSAVVGISDLMPPGLAQYQWEKHGVCSGLRPERYFELVRRAYESIDIPDEYEPLRNDAEVSPVELEQDFIVANPGLSARGLAVACNRRGTVEVRICLTRRLDFRRCLEVDADACRQRTLTLPATN